MAWYGWGSSTSLPLDKVELAVGPPFSNIGNGCQVPNPMIVPICPDGNSWCIGWPAEPSPEVLSPAYNGSGHNVGTWTGDGKCSGANVTTQAEYTAWYKQSIVETATGTGNFQYPKTQMSAWLCASTAQGTGGPMNESTPEGWQFYQAVGSSGLTPPGYQVTAVQSCTYAEGFSGGQIQAGPYTNDTGMAAIIADMATNPPTQCVKNLGR